MSYISRIPEITRALSVVTDAAIVAGAHKIAADAETRLAPHRKTGSLEQQLHVDEGQKDGVYVVAGDPGDPSFAFWGLLLEHGTSHSAPAPFLVPALEDNRAGIVASVSNVLGSL